MLAIFPGKEELNELFRYFWRQLELSNRNSKLSKQAQMDDLDEFDEIILANGIMPHHGYSRYSS